MSDPQIIALARGDLAVWTFGDGPPVLVLHGFPDHAIGMRSLAVALAANGYRAIVPALPGYAPSAVPADGDLSMTAVARDMVGLLDHLGIARAHVVGHDWGGIVGYRLGAEHGDRVASLTALAICHDAGFACGAACSASSRPAPTRGSWRTRRPASRSPATRSSSRPPRATGRRACTATTGPRCSRS